MKINLSKEEIKKGCELVDAKYGYYYHDGYLQLRACMITNPNKPYYRDFLQLVIEAINEKAENENYSMYIVQYIPALRVRFHELKKNIPYKQVKNFSFKDSPITEAKEKAISYVFENMED